MKKHILCIVMTLFVYISSTLNVYALDGSQTFSSYTDVMASDWYYTYVSDLSTNGVISGYPDGTFRAGSPVTCGEALRLILRAAGYDEQVAANGHWASGFLQLAVTNGFIGEGEIADLDSAINRVLIARIASKALNLPDSTISTPFSDTEDGHVLSLYEAGIVRGSYKSSILVYQPTKSITRAEISTVVWQIYNADSKPTQIKYGDYTLDVMKGVPVSTYDIGLFAMQNGFMRYGDPNVYSVTGVDVSEYQGAVDWIKVKAAGVDFAIIRLGYRGYSAGGLFADKNYKANLQGALDAGLDVGVYFFSQAITVEEAKAEADFVLSCIEGYDITYPVVFDWETVNSASARTNGLDTDTLTRCAQTFCDTVAAAGYKPMVYFNSRAGYLHYDLSRLTGYDFWYAQYYKIPSFYYNFHMWQYTSGGKVSGISGSVDMNICFKRY